MNQKTDTRPLRLFSRVLLAACLLPPAGGYGAALTLATAPLANSTNTTVLPNLMFILDDSGSMAWDYLPDWAGNDSNNSKPSNITSAQWQTLHNNAGYNGVYYNPATRYDPPVYFDADGTLDTTLYPSQIGTSSATGANTSASTPNWQSVKNDAYGVESTGSTNVQSSASYYTFIAGEYCNSPTLQTCVTQSAASSTYPYAAPLRWCSNTSLTTCQRTNTPTYKYVRYAGQVISAGQSATATLTISSLNNSTQTISSIQVDGANILSAAISYNGSSASTLASKIATNINNCTSSATGNCQTSGYSASTSGSGSTYRVIITAPVSLGNLTATPSVTRTTSPSGALSTSAFSGGVNGVTIPGSNVLTNIVSTNTSYPYPGTTTKAANRTDCAGSTCTYVEEMTNYANWWAYYHTRMQAMKTSVSRAFKNIGNSYRVGYSTISYTGASDSSNNFQHIDTFQLTQKNTWFTKFFEANPSSSTPLRGALSKAGRIYANKLTGAADPVQYSCQQNFTIMSTDGYWNTDAETSSYGPIGLTGSNVGDLDGGSTARPMYEGPTAVSNSLADVAKYYYDTDLRTSALGNCTGSLGLDVCTNDVFVTGTDNNAQQHMTTFTIGLGANGQLFYSPDYYTYQKDTPTTTYPPPTSGSMDYYDLLNGYGSPTVNWPVPVSNTYTAIDDLWHAAVNGHGIYFSAGNPDLIYSGFQQALASIQARLGAGAAAATSTLNPVAGNNTAFVASYTTVQWTGNLEARSIDTVTGAVGQNDIWCAENVAAGTGTTACNGTMESMVGTSSDTRSIYMNINNSLQPFTYANLTTAGLNSYFDSGFLSSHLSQWPNLSGTQQTLAAGANLVNFLRGQYGYEARTTNANQLYRSRVAVLGDATESRPAYVGAPTFSYSDPGYSAFKSAQASRTGTVYIGTNDGMLHAFNAINGTELWAFVPTPVIPNLWKLADENYATMHANYVNGAPAIFDICTANCTDSGTVAWKTILIGGLDGGGRGYYALDITTPTSPALLWEFTANGDSDLGYTFGNPVATKMSDGTWVVLFTSGYDNGSISGDGSTANSPAGSGHEFLYVVNAATGTVISKIGTGVGTASTPGGLSKIAAWADSALTDDTATYVYGGDLQGNLWRFDFNAASVLNFATLTDGGGSGQPITVEPELGKINNERVVFIGTGKYLEVSDLETTQQQSIYAILDANASSTLTNARSALVQQTLTTVGSTRTASNNPVDFTAGRGWFVDLPDSGERQNVDGNLVSGTLLMPSTVPGNSVCAPGGYSWLNFFNYLNGGPVDTTTNVVSSKANAPIVGINVYYINGQPVVSQVTADDPTPTLNNQVEFRTQAASFQKKKVLWRELIQ